MSKNWVAEKLRKMHQPFIESSIISSADKLNTIETAVTATSTATPICVSTIPKDLREAVSKPGISKFV